MSKVVSMMSKIAEKTNAKERREGCRPFGNVVLLPPEGCLYALIQEAPFFRGSMGGRLRVWGVPEMLNRGAACWLSKEPKMKRFKNPFAVVVFTLSLGFGVGSADEKRSDRSEVAPVDRAAKNTSGVSIRLSSETPVSGYERVPNDQGQIIYVSSQPAWTTADVLAVSEGPDRVAVQFTQESAPRIAGQLKGQVAVFLDGHLSTVAQVTLVAEGQAVELTGLLPGQAQRLTRILTAAPTATVGPMLSVVPRETVVAPGSTATVDIFLSGVVEMRAYQVALAMDQQGQGKIDLGEPSVDIERRDYVFAGQQSVQATDPTKGRALAALYSGAAPALETVYLATYTFDVGQDARGSFSVQIRENNDTLLRDSNGLPVGFQPAVPATITIGRVVRPSQRQ